MSVGGISSVLEQISQIQQQVSQLESGALPGAASAETGGVVTSTGDFADALNEAQSSDSSTSTSAATSTDTAADTGTDTTADSTAQTSGVQALIDSSGATSVTTASTTLPTSATTELTSDQQQFASQLSADTGLNPSVVSAWLLAEESGSAAQSRQAAGNNDWLNIGYTDSGSYGTGDAVWSDPTTAANATAEWLQGQSSISDYGTASSGIQAILQSVGQTPAAQIQAIQESGWSSSGYPSLDAIYEQVAGQ